MAEQAVDAVAVGFLLAFTDDFLARRFVDAAVEDRGIAQAFERGRVDLARGERDGQNQDGETHNNVLHFHRNEFSGPADVSAEKFSR